MGSGCTPPNPGFNSPRISLDLTSASLQKTFDHTSARAVHGIDDKALGIFSDQIKIDHFPQMLAIFQNGIELFDAAIFPGMIEIHQIWTASLGFIIREENFHPPALFGQR